MNLPAPSPPTCPKCSRPLASGALEGNCPTCLLGLATAVNLRAAPASRTSPAFRRYELLEKLAPGSVGVAWRARHRELGREVVLKMVDIDELGSPALLERFRLEAGAAARLEHPNIVPVLEAGEMDGRYLYTMPLLAGGSLADRIALGPLAPNEAARLVATAARAVHFAHQQGVLHGRLKASNVLLDETGEPRVADFGLASLAEADLETTHGAMARVNLAYVAPEQASGRLRDVTPAADVYSLGAILYEFLTGRPPFVAATPQATLRGVLSDVPVAPRAISAGVPRDLEMVTLKCLEKAPAQRYASAAALADELERCHDRRAMS